MNKKEVLSLLDNVIAQNRQALDEAERPIDYLKINVKTNVYSEVRNFIAENLEDVKESKKETPKA